MSTPAALARDVSITEEPAGSADVRWCFEQYFAELDRRFPEGFDVAAALPLGLDELIPPRGLVLLARLGGIPVGCAAIKLVDPQAAEIKRLWVDPSLRGHGLGARLLGGLESRALAAGRRLARLDTNGALPEAIALYRNRGYREVSAFNDEPYADHWFEKDLIGEPDGRSADPEDAPAAAQ